MGLVFENTVLRLYYSRKTGLHEWADASNGSMRLYGRRIRPSIRQTQTGLHRARIRTLGHGFGFRLQTDGGSKL